MQLNRLQCEQLRQHLFDGYGWDKEGVSDRKLTVAIEHLSASEKISDQQIIEKLDYDVEIQKKFLDELVIPETYFFRYPESFEYLKNTAKRWLINSRDKTLNIASIPCATGEEPYSIAIMLLEAGLSPSQFTIDALDISLPLILRAKEGIYAENRITRHELIETSRYFSHHAHGLKIKNNVKESVNFINGNITELPSSFFQKKYDIIFCRNLLIYLSNDNRIKLFKQLKKLLNSNGVIMVGPVEVNFFRSQGMHPTNDRKVYALNFSALNKVVGQTESELYKSKQNKTPSLVVTNTQALNASNQKAVFNKPSFSLKTSLLKHNETRRKTTQPKYHIDDIAVIDDEIDINEKNKTIEHARQLANAGLFNEALIISNELVKHTKNSDTYLLHGEILMALAEHSEAMNAFKRVLYIAPKNQQALQHLTLLLKKLGDHEQAQRYQNRLLSITEEHNEQ